MFEITGDDIQRLDDAQLRTLVARLAMAELSARRLPVAGVTAGGDQNAADGGLDVRVEVIDGTYSGDFIPCVPLGFQVKKPDMRPAAIAAEMKPKGILRPVIGELANASGAYNSIRSTLSEPAQCVRLIGMSGLGKTRLVQALFENDVGEGALDPSLAIYTDYSETPDHVSQIDRERIAEFSGGNFRVAGVLAETIERGDSLGDLRDRELFRRIFQQRNDHSDDLLEAAEALALVYSFDGEDTSASGELALLAPIAGVEVPKLYAFVAELKRRSVVQSRGRWRALLPHAIANRLAAQALERIPPDHLDTFCLSLPARMRKSLSRRLGYLHDNPEAQQAVARFLAPSGPLGNLLAADDDAALMLRSIAPVAPEAILQRIENEMAGANGTALVHPRTSHRLQLTLLLKSLAYAPELFDRAAKIVAKFVAAESPDENHNSARGAFEELFHLHLSGTQAPPDQRREFVRWLYGSGDPDGARCGHVALRALLQSGHFSSSSNFDFGARPRDFGWHPPTYGDIWDWYTEAVNLAVELSADTTRRAEIRRILSGALRGILGIEACLGAVEAATEDFLRDGEWIDGWLAIRGSIRFDAAGWRPEVKKRVSALEAKLRPSDPLNIARAYVMEGRGSGFDLLDGDKEEEKDYSAAFARLAQKAQSIGRDFGDQPDLLAEFLPEALRTSQTPRAFSFGVGLAESGTSAKQMWETLKTSLIAIPVEQRNPSVLGGFLHQSRTTDPALVSSILDEILDDSDMAASFLYLQGQVGIDDEAIERLRHAISLGHIEARQFYFLISGAISTAPQGPLSAMLDELSALDGGTAAALEILHMAIYCLKSDGLEVDGILLDTGHNLLLRTDYGSSSDVREHRVQDTIKDCYGGPAGEQGARALCQHLKRKIAAREVRPFQLDYMFDSLFEVQPLVALDELMLTADEDGDDPIYGDIGLSRRSPLEKVTPSILWTWADLDPAVRYSLISRSLNIFATKGFDDDTGLSPLFLEGLERSPDRAAYLAHNAGRLHPSGWSGNLSAILDRRRAWLEPLTHHPDETVSAWAIARTADLQRYADHERERESDREETFE